MKLDFIWSLCINTIRESFDFNNFVGFFFGWTTFLNRKNDNEILICRNNFYEISEDKNVFLMSVVKNQIHLFEKIACNRFHEKKNSFKENKL